MSLIKRYIESEKLKGNDPLHEDHIDMLDDEYQMKEASRLKEHEWCFYAGMPSPSAYENSEEDIE